MALGGCLGLRSSEAQRLLVRDVDLAAGTLAVGARKRKREASRRTLPLPPMLLAWIRPLVEDREPDKPLLLTKSPRRPPGPFNPTSWGHWLAPLMESATGRRMPPKRLRGSFATWTMSAKLPPRLIESYLGHTSALVLRVTARHYLAAAAIEELRPAALLIDRVFSRAMFRAAARRNVGACRGVFRAGWLQSSQVPVKIKIQPD